jgi:TrmH family RNA methyltransferase
LFKLKPYKKNLEYSYAFGVFPVVELLEYKINLVDQVILASTWAEDSKIKQIVERCDKFHIPHSINDHKIKSLAPKENTSVIAVYSKFETELELTKPHVVLVSPTNMGNLGMIIRTMVAFNFHNLAIIRPAADIYDPKVSASSVGSLFQMNFQYFNTLQEYLSKYSKRDIYTFIIDQAKDIRKVDFSKYKDHQSTFSFVMGNEANGLSSADAALGEKILIPQFGNLNSLNLSIATSIALWEASRIN